MQQFGTSVPCCQQRHQHLNCGIDLCNEGALLGALDKVSSLQYWSIPSKHELWKAIYPPTAFCLMGLGGCNLKRMPSQTGTNIYYATIVMQTKTYWCTDLVTKNRWLSQCMSQIISTVPQEQQMTADWKQWAIWHSSHLILAPSGGVYTSWQFSFPDSHARWDAPAATSSLYLW